MRVFLTGAGGFIGGAVASAMVADGHSVRGLVRNPGQAAVLAAQGIEPVIGVLEDANLLEVEAQLADGVVNCADSDHRGAIETLLRALAGSGKVLIHTSGSSVVSDEAMGEPSDKIFSDDSPFYPLPDKVARVEIDRLVLAADGIRSTVLCNTMIYGDAVRAKRAMASGVAAYVGRGLNRWSNAHIDDVAALYVSALKHPEPGGFMFVESGEEALGVLVQAMASRLGLGTARSLPAEQAIVLLGREVAVFALGSNSRVRGKKAVEVLGWRPKHCSILNWIETDIA